MSFIGTLVAWQGSGSLGDLLSIASYDEPFEVRGRWTISYLNEELVGEAAVPLLRQICQKTDAPALSAFVFESDCAFVGAAEPTGSIWNTCLARHFVASLDNLNEIEMASRYGLPSESATRGVAWAQAASLVPDRPSLEAVFAYTGLEEDEVVFPGIDLFGRMLDGLGLPASETPTFYGSGQIAPESDHAPSIAESIVRRAAPLVIDGVGQFEFDCISDSAIYIRVSDATARALADSEAASDIGQLTGFGTGTELPELAADQVWIQSSHGDAVLVVRRGGRAEHAAFFFIGPLGDLSRKMAAAVGVQVFIVVSDEPLAPVLNRLRTAAIDSITMWSALVACTAEG